MAKINREMFIPYIKNLCALHVLLDKLHDRAQELEYHIDIVERGKPEPQFSAPLYEPVWTFGRVCAIFVAIIMIIPVLICPYSELDMTPALWVGPVGLICIAFGIIVGTLILVKEDKAENRSRENQYEAELRERKRIRDNNEKVRAQRLPSLYEELGYCNDAYAETEKMLELTYGANIIPGRYRNIHAVIYLYDWFDKSVEDDLGMALNTFVLELIKDKLDDIIRNQGEILLNQQMRLSLQMQSNEERERHNRAMEEKIDRLQLTEEERNDNLKMIARTNSSVEWYAQQHYIRKII